MVLILGLFKSSARKRGYYKPQRRRYVGRWWFR